MFQCQAHNLPQQQFRKNVIHKDENIDLAFSSVSYSLPVEQVMLYQQISTISELLLNTAIENKADTNFDESTGKSLQWIHKQSCFFFFFTSIRKSSDTQIIHVSLKLSNIQISLCILLKVIVLLV